MNEHSFNDADLLEKISANLGKAAFETGMTQSWQVRVIDDNDKVVCAGDLKDTGGKFGIANAKQDDVAMFHPPYRAELTDSSSGQIHQPSIDRQGHGLEKAPLKGGLPPRKKSTSP